MACRKCGAGSAVVPESQITLSAQKSSGDMVLIQYIGTQTQKRRVRSKVSPSEQYVFGGGQDKFYAYRGDIEWLTSLSTQFKIADVPTVIEENKVADVPVLTSEMKPPKLTDFPLDILNIDPVIIALLKRKFSTVNEIKNAGKADWMTIKGIGAARADQIQEALNALP